MKDKFYNALPQWVNWEDAEKCEQIADEYAIGFAEWIAEYSWEHDYRKQIRHTTKQLLELYKQSLKTTI